MTTFRFRPAPVRPEQRYTLQDGHLSGPDWDLALDDLTDLGFTSYRAYGRMIWRLDLTQGKTRHRINANLPVTGAATTDDFAAFHSLASALVDDLSRRNPDLQIGFGERGIARHAIFAMGVVSALGGLGIGLAASTNGRLVEAAVPALLLSVSGLGLARSNAPWAKPPLIDPASLPAVLTRLAAG